MLFDDLVMLIAILDRIHIVLNVRQGNRRRLQEYMQRHYTSTAMEVQFAVDPNVLHCSQCSIIIYPRFCMKDLAFP